MQTVTLKLKQASVVLGVPPKDLQNLVQLGVIRPARRNSVFWFDTNLLLKAKVAFYLKEALGSSSDLLARFTEALSQDLGKIERKDLRDICLRSRPLNGSDAVEINRSLSESMAGKSEHLDKSERVDASAWMNRMGVASHSPFNFFHSSKQAGPHK